MARTATSPQRTVRHLPITQARVNLGAVIKRVRIDKEYIILEKDGLPVAGLMDIDEFEDYLDLQNPHIQRHIAASVRESRGGKTRPASDLLAELRAADARERRPPRTVLPVPRASARTALPVPRASARTALPVLPGSDRNLESTSIPSPRSRRGSLRSSGVRPGRKPARV